MATNRLQRRMHSGCTLTGMPTGVPLADSNVSVVNVGHAGNTFGS